MAPRRLLLKPLNYSNKVLIGEWSEERSSYKKNIFKHTSAYSDDYSAKPPCKHDPGILWDAKIKAQGSGLFSPDLRENADDFDDNFSTTYDLSFNHFPKWFGDIIYREWQFRLERHHPFDEYLQTYGNITETGLTEKKTQEWAGDIEDPRSTVDSLYRASYSPLGNSAYKFRRWFRTKPIKTKDGDMVYKGYPEDHPSIVKCNPITGECKGEPLQNSLQCCCDNF